MAGWLNWSFNVFPLLRPCLNALYAKIGALKRPRGYVIVNKAISRELEWAEQIIKNSNGVVLLQELEWTPQEANHTIFCDASLVGLGFWLPSSNEGFASKVPPGIPAEMNFFRKALCVISAIDYIAQCYRNTKLIIFSDNKNTVDMFSSLATRPDYNCLLTHAISQIIRSNIRLKVIHVPGECNHVADSLSHRLWQRAHDFSPGLTIINFLPPRDALGAYQK